MFCPPRARMMVPATFPVDDRRAVGRRPDAGCRTCEGSDVQAVFRTEMAAGHGGVSGRYKSWHDRAFTLAWMLDRMRLAEVSAERQP